MKALRLIFIVRIRKFCPKFVTDRMMGKNDFLLKLEPKMLNLTATSPPLNCIDSLITYAGKTENGTVSFFVVWLL